MLRALQEHGRTGGGPGPPGHAHAPPGRRRRDRGPRSSATGRSSTCPHWQPIHIGSFTLDLSPTKHVVFVVLAALVVLAVFIPIGRAMQSKYRDRAPKGFANAMEAMIVFFRDEVVRRSIGHGADAYTPYILSLFFFILDDEPVRPGALGRVGHREPLGHRGAGPRQLHRGRGLRDGDAGIEGLRTHHLLRAAGAASRRDRRSCW